MAVLMRALPWIVGDETMLAHLAHYEARNTADALAVLEKPEHLDVWVVFHFPDANRARKPKAVLYGRMWAFRRLGIDAMVRQLANGRFVLVVRRYGPASGVAP